MNLAARFSLKALTPSFESEEFPATDIARESRRCCSSGEAQPCQTSPLMSAVERDEQLAAISWARARPAATVASGVRWSEEKRVEREGCEAGWTRAVCNKQCQRGAVEIDFELTMNSSIARECPMRRGRKYDDVASGTIPR